MTAVVQAMWQPDRAAMLQHVEHLFGGFLDGYHDGLIELAWTDDKPDEAGRYRLKNARLFGTDQLEELVDLAVELNSKPMTNVYIGAALRHPDTAPFGRCTDEDAWALPAFYTDLDDEGVTARVKSIYGDTKPTLVVLTGKEPYTRAQLWWRLAEPINDPVLWSAALKGMARALDGDTTVTNPGRVMRLAGSIAWPVKPGRTVELTAINPLKKPGPPEYMAEHLLRVFPPAAADQSAPVQVTETVTRSTNSLGLADKITDGRERYMRDTLVAVLIEFIGQNGCAPTAQELFDAAWPQYERKVDLSRPGRGAEEFAEKCEYTIKRFERGDIPRVRTLDDAIAVYQRKQVARETAKAAGVEFAPAQPLPPEPEDEAPFCATDFSGEPPPLQWLVDEWIPRGVIVALYGDGGVGKTLIAQQLLYAAGIGSDWLGMPVPQMKGLGVFCEDDRDELHRRHNAIKNSFGITVGNPFDDVWIWPRVGFDNLLVTFDKDNRPTMSAFFEKVMKHVLEKRVGLLVLDTVADLYGGNEIVRAQVNFFIKSTCGAFIRKAKEAGFELTVILLAHPSQSGRESGRGDGGSTAWSNAVRARLYLTKPDDGGVNDRVLSRKKSNYSASGDDTAIELEWREGTIQPRSSNSGLPDRETCHLMLDDIEDAWHAGYPLSTASQTKKDGRYAARVLARKYHGNERAFEQLIEMWLENRILAVGICNQHTKTKGLQVVGRLE